MKYAHIHDGTVREVFTLDRARKPNETPQAALNMPETFDIRKVADSVEAGWIVDGDKLRSPDPAQPDHASEARGRLAATDRVPVRCIEDGLEYPAAWRAYRSILRQVASTGALPEGGWPKQPEYPAAT